MDFAYSSRVTDLRARLLAFMEQHVVPAIPAWEREVAAGRYPPSVVEPLKAEAKALGLWNLFLPGLEGHEPGTRLSNLDYAPLAEVMGRVFWASELFNCSAPDTGNMEILAACFGDARASAREIPGRRCSERRDPLLLRHDRAGRWLRRTPPTSRAASCATATSTSSTVASGGAPGPAIHAAGSPSSWASHRSRRRAQARAASR